MGRREKRESMDDLSILKPYGGDKKGKFMNDRLSCRVQIPAPCINFKEGTFSWENNLGDGDQEKLECGNCEQCRGACGRERPLNS
jgi:hypothetical protein